MRICTTTLFLSISGEVTLNDLAQSAAPHVEAQWPSDTMSWGVANMHG